MPITWNLQIEDRHIGRAGFAWASAQVRRLEQLVREGEAMLGLHQEK